MAFAILVHDGLVVAAGERGGFAAQAAHEDAERAHPRHGLFPDRDPVFGLVFADEDSALKLQRLLERLVPLASRDSLEHARRVFSVRK